MNEIITERSSGNLVCAPAITAFILAAHFSAFHKGDHSTTLKMNAIVFNGIEANPSQSFNHPLVSVIRPPRAMRDMVGHLIGSIEPVAGVDFNNHSFE